MNLTIGHYLSIDLHRFIHWSLIFEILVDSGFWSIRDFGHSGFWLIGILVNRDFGRFGILVIRDFGRFGILVIRDFGIRDYGPEP